MIYDKISINSSVCSLYSTKLIYNYRKIRKKTKIIPLAEIEDIRYSQSNLQKVFGLGTIVIKRRTRNIMDRFTYIDTVPDIEVVFGKIQEVYK